jgi:DNA-binding GntR family transcriptional regulator
LKGAAEGLNDAMTDNKAKMEGIPPKLSIREEVIEYIKERILSGTMAAGDRIVETKLAKEMGISTTPIRAALRYLEGEGIIMTLPNKGPIVCPLDKNDVFEIYTVRSMLEGLAIRLVTLNATAEDIADLEQVYEKMLHKVNDNSVKTLLAYSFSVHEKIVTLSRNAHLIAKYQSLSLQIALVNRLVGTATPKQEAADMHLELIEAVKSKDPDFAETVIRKHIHKAYIDFVKLLEKSKQESTQFDERSWL